MPDQPQSPAPSCDVLIAGGGVAGLALALALRQASEGTLAVRLHDPALAKPPGRRAFAIAAGTRRMLETLGVWSDIAAGAQPLTAMDITDSTLDEPVRPLFLSFEGEVEPGEAFAHMIEEGPLAEALRGAAERAGVAFSATAISGFAAGRDRITMQAADGTSVAGAVLVAADGARSRLREIAGNLLLRLELRPERHRRHHPPRAAARGPGGRAFPAVGPFALLPLPGDRSSIVWTERRGRRRRSSGAIPRCWRR